MNTRSKSDPLNPPTDPEAIIKAANAARRKAKTDALLRPESVFPANSDLATRSLLPSNFTLNPENPIPQSHDPTSDMSGSHSPQASASAGPTQTPTTVDPLALHEYLKGVIQLQHRSIDQANADRLEARENRRLDAERIARLEETILLLSVKPEPSGESPKPAPSDRIDLQRFRNSDGPMFTGPFQAVEPFISWLRGVQIFFATKAVTHDDDKLRIVGGLIRETNTLAFYASGIDEFIGKSWANFKAKLLAFALPPLWRTDLRTKLRDLRMSHSESFLAYSTRARTLQSMLNFDEHTTSDFTLAESMTLGMSADLQADVNNHQLLLADPFDFSVFESRAGVFWTGIMKRAGGRAKSSAAPQPSTSQRAGKPSREETIWRVQSYLDSQGLCHFCRKACGSAHGACTGQRDRSFLSIPDSFKPPPKPDNYKAPGARGSVAAAGKPTQPPAGRPSGRAATVAGVTEEDLFPAMDAASISALEALDEELRLSNTEKYVIRSDPRRIVIHLTHANQTLRGLIDTGSELNLISTAAADRAGMAIQRCDTPTIVKLALDDNATQPIVLRHFVTGTFSDPNSPLTFEEVSLKVGAVNGDYDMILGIPFLSKFQLSVSISDQSLVCGHTGCKLFDYRLHQVIQPKLQSSPSLCVLSSAEPEFPCEEREKAILNEFSDLFPADIPAVSDDQGNDGPFQDGSFPAKLQLKSSKVRHKIILTDPNAVINEKQYPYPRKHMQAWRTLLDQHIAAGRIRRSSSQYASPSMIIPKKDPTALPRWVCDYRTLNKFTVRDRSPLPNVDELVRMVASGKVFSILDQTNAFFQTRMREDDIPLTAVKTPWGLMEWVVMPMGLTNAPATHQARLEEALGELINNICVVYLDDIVIFSDSFLEHETHVRRVLERLRAANLYCSPKKTLLFRKKVKFLGHWISQEGVCADESKVADILDWPTPRSAKAVKKFLGTVQWMKKFIWGLQKYVGTLTPLTSSKLNPKDFRWGEAEELAFNNIKKIMTSLPCLKNIDYESDDPLWLFTDASGSGLGAALFQGKEWKSAFPIAYESHLMTPAEKNYPVHEQELLAVIHALQKWKMLLLGMKINVMSDHHSLTHLLKQRSLSRRQARWTEILADFDLNFEYVKGEENTVADALSRKNIVDDELDIGVAEVCSVAALTELGATFSPSLKASIRAGYTEDSFCVALRKVLPLRDDCAEIDGLLFVDSRLVVPDSSNLRDKLTEEAHIRLGHLGYLKTITELRRDFFWPRMNKDVARFVQSCATCQKTKAPTTSPAGKMLTPSMPRAPLADLAIDFVGPLPKSNNYDMILTCTCRLSGFTRILPVVQSDTAEKTASRLFSGWMATFGAPTSIISDRDKAWTSKFWKALMAHLNIRFHMSSAFHPQADGRSERTNKTVGQILRSFTAKRQGKWLAALPAAEFAINSAINVATGISPFELVFGRKPGLFPSIDSSPDSPPNLKRWLDQREGSWANARDSLWLSRVRQAIQHNRHNRPPTPLKAGDWALLNSADWRGRKSGVDKLKERFEGPYRVARVFNHDQNVELELPEGDRRHPTFHTSKVKLFYAREEEAPVDTAEVSSSHIVAPPRGFYPPSSSLYQA